MGVWQAYVHFYGNMSINPSNVKDIHADDKNNIHANDNKDDCGNNARNIVSVDENESNYSNINKGEIDDIKDNDNNKITKLITEPTYQ